ncbi:DegQ family serine endoprotease [Thiohalobacter thiocyanaticus]|uniref:Probable periplasmic serine endoprotease DegP-like n=1 Tax=Thiohalobacter thiocyanaticus TaxID=585455 RepID=A0A426QHK6_9GAMM|nr:DegQ family serine endoprotease [Thiohalobacter thiocyanaticus]RRQ21196.1 DegQ family serine endoprotease [Thiohalobacter thiocyanaticus]
MKFKIASWLNGLALFGLVGLTQAAAAPWSSSLPDFSELVEQNSPVVVNISTTQVVKSPMSKLPPGMELPDLPEDSPFGDLFRHFFEGEPGEPREHEAKSLGSGVIISKDGYILTNNHVVQDAKEIIVRFNNRDELVAEVVGTDPRSDVALLKVEAEDLPVARLGKAEELKVGEWVLAIGSPFGFESSATAGIVSAKGRALPSENYVPFIQTDVAINPGNSGGPLFNMDGEVVGVNSQIFSRTGGYMGLSFAIPIEVAMDVAEQLKTEGRVSRGWLGVLIQEVTRDLAQSFGLDKPQGALVSKVVPDSPAAKAGLQVGDIILEFNGRQVIRSRNLPHIVGSTPVGKRAEVRILRDGKRRTLQVTLGELEDDQQAAAEPAATQTGKSDRLGLVVASVPAELREQLELGEGGVMIQELKSGAASRAGVREGDIIVRFNNETVKDVEHFNRLVEGMEKGSSVPVLIQRRSGPLFLAIRVPE